MADNEEEVVRHDADDRYGSLDKDLVELLKNYEYTHFREDKPIPFCGLNIYPVQVRNYEEFASCCSCLTLNKNEDPNGVAMSHLDYLISKLKIEENNEGRIWSFKLQRLFELIFRIKNGLKCEHCGNIMEYTSPTYLEYKKKIADLIEQIQKNPEAQNIETPQLLCPECGGDKLSNMISIVQDPKTKKNAFSVDGHIINKNDFVKLRQIVLFQNYPDYADESDIDPEVKKDHDEKMRIQMANNDVHATIEKKVIGLSVATHYKPNEVYDMSIRRFTMSLSTVDDLINYKIMKQSVMSGFVSLPKGKTVEHWLYKPNKDIYGDSYKSTDQVQESVSNL